MQSFDDRPSIEFLAVEGDDDTFEDELAPRPRRLRLPLLLMAGAAVIVAGVVVAATGPQTAPAGSSPSAAAGVRAHRASPLDPGHWRALGPVLECPASASCEVRTEIAAPVRAAVERRLPHLSGLQVTSSEQLVAHSAPRLLGRVITGRDGPVRLTIAMGQPRKHDEDGWNASETPTRTLVVVATHVGGRFVQLRLSAPAGHELSISAARRLAADPRLAAASGS